MRIICELCIFVRVTCVISSSAVLTQLSWNEAATIIQNHNEAYGQHKSHSQSSILILQYPGIWGNLLIYGTSIDVGSSETIWQGVE